MAEEGGFAPPGVVPSSAELPVTVADSQTALGSGGIADREPDPSEHLTAYTLEKNVSRDGEERAVGISSIPDKRYAEGVLELATQRKE